MVDVYIEDGPALVYVGSGSPLREIVELASEEDHGHRVLDQEKLAQIMEDIRTGAPPKELARYSTHELEKTITHLITPHLKEPKMKIHIV